MTETSQLSNLSMAGIILLFSATDNISSSLFVKNRVGGRGVNLDLDNVFKYTGLFFRLPLTYCSLIYLIVR